MVIRLVEQDILAQVEASTSSISIRRMLRMPKSLSKAGKISLKAPEAQLASLKEVISMYFSREDSTGFDLSS